MAADWNTPSLTTAYSAFLTALLARDVDIATQFNNGTATNIPTGAIMWNTTTNRWNKWSGSAWAELTATYDLTNLIVEGTFQIKGATGTTPSSGLTWSGGWQNYTAGLQVNGNTIAAATGSNTFTMPAATDTLVGRSSTDTMTNKRITPRVSTLTTSATITPTSDVSDLYTVTALATAATIAAPSGTPTNGQLLVLRILDNGTARALTWTVTSGAYRAVNVTLPTTTVAGKTLYVTLRYNAADSFWDAIDVGQSAGVAPPPGVSKGLKIDCRGVSNFLAVITAAAITLTNSAGQGYVATSVNVSPSINTSGANGLDTGTSTASTWYYAHVIYNHTTGTVAGLLSLSSTAPALPSGYTHSAYVGAVRTDSSGSKYLLNTLQNGDLVSYIITAGSNSTTTPIIASGVTGTYSSNTSVAYASVSVGSLVPPTASHIQIRLSPNANNTGPSYTGIAPSTAYGAPSSLLPSFMSTDATGQQTGLAGMMVLQSTSVGVYISAAGGVAFCTGWRENL